MIPAWKIKRELVRIKERSLRRVERLVETHQRKAHDRSFEARVQAVAGDRPAGSKIAVFVLFQPKGLAKTVSLTLRHLIANGYAPFVVTNAPLSEADRETVGGLAWRVVERPNFGYDFGAYRDAIKMLWRDGINPEALILMNDSTWFPLRENDDAIARIEAKKTAFSGFIFKQEPYSKHTAWHLESHFLYFGRAAVNSAAFRAFWSDYKMTSDRTDTIVNGEKAISQAMIRAGFHPQPLLCHATFLLWFAGIPSAAQRKVLEDATYHIDERTTEISRLLKAYADTPQWRKLAFAQVNDMLSCMEFFTSTTFVATAMQEFGLPFLKKSSEPHFRVQRFGHDRFDDARRKVLSLHDLGQIQPLDPMVEIELRTAVRGRKVVVPVDAIGKPQHA